MTIENKVWNRAALESGGASPGPGDRALASLLLVHGLVMNGGVHHALESIELTQLLAAADGDTEESDVLGGTPFLITLYR